MRRHIAALIDDNWARQIRLPRTLKDFRTPELQTAGDNVAAKVIERRAWLADRSPKASVTTIKFGGAVKS